jgi:hypothetical protein
MITRSITASSPLTGSSGEDGQRYFERRQTLLEPRLATAPSRSARHERATLKPRDGQPRGERPTECHTQA